MQKHSLTEISMELDLDDAGEKHQQLHPGVTSTFLNTCCKPSDQSRDAARREECSDLDEKSLTTFVVVMGGRKGFAREHQNGFFMRLKMNSSK